MKRTLLIGTGCIFVGLAFLGIVLPGVPTTPFLIVAAGCFAKSSPKLYSWLLKNKVLSPIIKNWEESRSIPKKAKVFSLILIFVVGILSVILTELFYLKLLIPILLTVPIIILLRLKTTEEVSRSLEKISLD